MRYLLSPEEIAVIRSRCEGSDVVATLDYQDSLNGRPDREALLDAAREAHCIGSDDEIEVDDDASLSPGEEGCWVEGWLWIPYPEAGDEA